MVFTLKIRSPEKKARNRFNTHNRQSRNFNGTTVVPINTVQYSHRDDRMRKIVSKKSSSNLSAKLNMKLNNNNGKNGNMLNGFLPRQKGDKKLIIKRNSSVS